MDFVSLQGVKPRFAIAVTNMYQFEYLAEEPSYAGPTARSRQPPGLQLQNGVLL